MSGSPFPHHDRPMAAGLSDVGMVRKRNEDSHSVPAVDASVESLDHYGRLFAVADGMGGHSGGDIASQTVIETLIGTFYDGSTEEVFPRLQRALDAANEAVVARAAADPNLADMGATLTAVALRGQAPCMATLAHVGDSRAYLIRDGTISQISEEHTFIAEAIRTGTLTEAEAAVHPNRHAITRAMGRAGGIQAYYGQMELQPGDRLVLCSDGLTNVVTDYEILQHALAYAPDDAVHHLVALANERGGPDNVTVVLIAMPGAEISIPAPVPLDAGPNAPTVVLRPMSGGPGGRAAGRGGPVMGPAVGPLWNDGPGVARTAPLGPGGTAASMAPGAAGRRGLWVRLGGIAAVSLALVGIVLVTSLGVDRKLSLLEKEALLAQQEAESARSQLATAVRAGDPTAEAIAQATMAAAGTAVANSDATLVAARAKVTLTELAKLTPTPRKTTTAATRDPSSAAISISLQKPIDGDEIKSCSVRLVWKLDPAQDLGALRIVVHVCRLLRDDKPDCEQIDASPDRLTVDYRPTRPGRYSWRVNIDGSPQFSEQRTFELKDGGCAGSADKPGDKDGNELTPEATSGRNDPPTAVPTPKPQPPTEPPELDPSVTNTLLLGRLMPFGQDQHP